MVDISSEIIKLDDWSLSIPVLCMKRIMYYCNNKYQIVTKFYTKDFVHIYKENWDGTIPKCIVDPSSNTTSEHDVLNLRSQYQNIIHKYSLMKSIIIPDISNIIFRFYIATILPIECIYTINSQEI